MKIGLRFSLANYYLANRDCFDTLTLPDGYDKEVFTATVIQECGQFGIAQSVINFQQQIELWGIRRRYMLNELMQTTLQKYNMVENYDRFEEWDENGTNENHTTNGGVGDSNGTTTSKSAGFNSEELKIDEQAESVSHSESTNQTDGNGADTRHHTAHIHGNIGITSAMDLLKQSREIANFDPYLEAARIFAHDLLIPMYLY